jgi:bifunctional UDP-N-acetylglucosamine pyrophosphorylase/glucosamine-1-phosphate N-acetyltransferase
MSDVSIISPLVQRLIQKGIKIHCPYSVEVDDSVNPERIASSVIIHSGCRISGDTTSIGPGSELGKEGPAVIENCQLGHKVELKGGYFSGATFLDAVSIGSAAHVRPATLLEEESSAAHAVGLKQTIFLPFVTAGSLINFCDALMAGGTSRKDHSEIGSSYIHFNFTPHQDKATPSLVGDVPRGVFLDQPPIFLGGQGGLVGPARIAFGTVIPAGTICRQDVLEERGLFTAPDMVKEGRVFVAGVYRGINRIVKNNLIYIGNLWALKAWYRFVRVRTMSTDPYRKACHSGALTHIEEALNERVKRLRELAENMPHSLERARAETGEALSPGIQTQQQALIERWPEMEANLVAGPSDAMGAAPRDVFLREWEQMDTASSYQQAVRAISPSARKTGKVWLQEMVDSASALWTKI